MLDKILSYIAPHHCCGCDKIGTLLCDNCKNDIIEQAEPACLNCHRPTTKMWLCEDCRTPYERAWAVGEREGTLQRLIGLYKFQRARDGYAQLASLLDETLPNLPSDTVIVPIPTKSSHIRERGYDHTLLIARHLAKQRGLVCKELIERSANTQQRHASASKRLSQAKQTFTVTGILDDSIPYLIIDDVITSGATIKYASKALRKAGAKHVWVAVVARQVLH